MFGELPEGGTEVVCEGSTSILFMMSLKSFTKLNSKKNIWQLHTQILYINVTNVSALCTVGTKRKQKIESKKGLYEI